MRITDDPWFIPISNHLSGLENTRFIDMLNVVVDPSTLDACVPPTRLRTLYHARISRIARALGWIRVYGGDYQKVGLANIRKAGRPPLESDAEGQSSRSTIELPGRTWIKVKELAKDMGCTISEVVEEALEMYLSKISVSGGTE